MTIRVGKAARPLFNSLPPEVQRSARQQLGEDGIVRKAELKKFLNPPNSWPPHLPDPNRPSGRDPFYVGPPQPPDPRTTVPEPNPGNALSVIGSGRLNNVG